MSRQKSIPVLTSIAIILIVAALRDRSRAVAAVLATMPINVPLALWVVSSGNNNEQKAMTDFVRSILISLFPSWVWLIIVFVALRAGGSLWLAIASGYAAWLVLVAALFWFGVLAWPR